MAGAIGPARDAEPAVTLSGRAAQVAAIKRYIGQHLDSPRLDVSDLCRRFRVSRSALYRLFEPEGGLARNIQDRRLYRAFSQLLSASRQDSRILDLAIDAGFSSDATFIRAFRRVFGMTPGEVRFQAKLARAGYRPPSAAWPQTPNPQSGCGSWRYSGWRRSDYPCCAAARTCCRSHARPVGGPPGGDAKAHEVSRNFSENKERPIAPLRKAISALEEEIADAGPVVEPAKQSTATPLTEATQESKTTPKAGEIRMPQPRRWGGVAFEAHGIVWHDGGEGAELPALVAAASNRAQECFIEFFTANIRNRNTRRGCAQAVSKFLAWCEDHRVPSITAVRPVRVAGYIEELTHAHSAPTAKQRLSAIRHLFDWLVVGQVMPTNPASSVRRSSHVVKRGKTPVLSPDAIDVSTHAGLRDRALTPAVLQGGEHPLAAPVPPANTRECAPRPDASAPDQPGSAGPLLTDRPPAGCALRTPPHGGLAASMDGWAWSMAIPLKWGVVGSRNRLIECVEVVGSRACPRLQCRFSRLPYTNDGPDVP